MRATLLFLVFLISAPVAMAQSFAPAINVNDLIITEYELDQRTRMLGVLGAASNAAELARTQLIEDRLKQQAMRQAGISTTPEEVQEGMIEFAARGNLTSDQFIQILRERGVSRETFRDFVSVGLAWRVYVGQRFRPQARVTEAEIDRRIALSDKGTGLRVLLSEIILPNVPELAAESRARADRIKRITSTAAFSNAAREFSFAQTRANGGRLDWRPLASFAPELRQVILGLNPGQVSEPLELGNALVLFQLRAIEELESETLPTSAVEFATYQVPAKSLEASRTAAMRIAEKLDTCDDLYGVAKGQPEERLNREVRTLSDLPQDLSLELAKLDASEVSYNLVAQDGTSRLLVMLCGRTQTIDTDVDRGAVRTALFNERVAALAESFLDQLQADARILE
ncbi:MAG: peptidylprolyl isomerase [Pseudomonadota bacterium]